MNRFLRWSAVLALAFCLSPAIAAVAAIQPVKLRFDPRFVLEVVAKRMHVTLRPEVPLPGVFLESRTPLAQFQKAMAGQWPFTPPLIANSYSIATNEIYLSDDALFYLRLKRTLDDSLAHEFVHYIQSKYLKEDLTTDGCEMQAAEIQQWFREEYMTGNRVTGDAAPGCRLVQGADGARTVQCVTGARPVPG
ncbi:MAG TPA: hypothetical protein VFN70_01610 [Burkholderiales bacterium]|nr:hypothetical protein [Burkholderiales bacterium]